MHNSYENMKLVMQIKTGANFLSSLIIATKNESVFDFKDFKRPSLLQIYLTVRTVHQYMPKMHKILSTN